MEIYQFFPTMIAKESHPEFLEDSRKLFEKHKDFFEIVREGYLTTLSRYESQWWNETSVDIINDELNSPLVQTILVDCEKYLTGIGFFTDQVELYIKSMWMNKTVNDGKVDPHTHGGAIVSGCYYIDVPKNAPPIDFGNPLNVHRYAKLPIREQNPLISSSVSIFPTSGDLLMWHSFVEHSVTPTQCYDERTVIAFDISARYKELMPPLGPKK
jgi:uncharacterized protein (TIGR02466 family)